MNKNTSLSMLSQDVEAETFFREYAQVILDSAKYAGLRASDWDDVLMEVADLFLVKKKAKYDPSKASMKTYVAKIARNRAFSMMQAYRKNAELPEDTEKILPDESPNVYDSMIAAEMQKMLSEGLKRLEKTGFDKRKIEIFKRNVMDSEKPARLARDYGMTAAQVSTAIYKCRNRYRGIMLEISRDCGLDIAC